MSLHLQLIFVIGLSYSFGRCCGRHLDSRLFDVHPSDKRVGQLCFRQWPNSLCVWLVVKYIVLRIYLNDDRTISFRNHHICLFYYNPHCCQKSTVSTKEKQTKAGRKNNVVSYHVDRHTIVKDFFDYLCYIYLLLDSKLHCMLCKIYGVPL